MELNLSFNLKKTNATYFAKRRNDINVNEKNDHCRMHLRIKIHLLYTNGE